MIVCEETNLIFITICACLYHSWKKNTMFELVVLDLYYITVTKQLCEFHHDSQCEEADWRWWWWWMVQTTGSLYFWAAHLAGPRWGPLASWVCAWLEAIGLIAGIGTQVFCLFLLKLLLLLLTTVPLQISCFPVGLMSEWIESKGYTNTHTHQFLHDLSMSDTIWSTQHENNIVVIGVNICTLIITWQTNDRRHSWRSQGLTVSMKM